LKPNCPGMIIGRSSIKNVHLVPIRQQTWLPQAILVSDWLISKKSSSETDRCFLPNFISFGQAVTEEKIL
jgi:hypothetical protein